MSTAPTTRAQVIDSFGGPEQFRSEERPISAPGAGQVQLKVAAAAVNPVDISTRAGTNIPAEDARFPMVLGWDLAGTIEQIGDGVEGWEVGDRVAAMTFQPADQNGSYTQHINLAADLVARVPDGLALAQAATIPLAGLTASQIVRRLDLPARASVLVNGPVGAVGRLVVQPAGRDGITVIAVAKPEHRDDAVELGAAEVVDRGHFAAGVRDLHPGGTDAAVDLVGGTAAQAALASARDGGAYITAVPPYIDPTGPFDSERDIRLEVLAVHPDTADLTGLLEAAGRGELTTPSSAPTRSRRPPRRIGASSRETSRASCSCSPDQALPAPLPQATTARN